MNSTTAPLPTKSEHIKLVSLSDLILESAKPTDWLVEDIYATGEAVLISGASHSGKTYLLLDQGLAVAYGTPWLGRFATKQAPVIYSPSEGRAGIGRRVTSAIEHHYPYDDVAGFFLFPENLDLTTGPSLHNLARATEQYDAGLVIVDVLRDATTGVEENSAAMGDAFGRLRDLAQYTGATVVVAHHLGKDAAKGSRGHSSLKDKADQEVLVKAAPVMDGLGGIAYTTVNVENSKNRNNDNWGTLSVDLRNSQPEDTPVITGERGIGTSSPATTAGLHMVGAMVAHAANSNSPATYGGCTLTDLVDALGGSRQAHTKTLEPLISEGFVEVDKTEKANRYMLTAKGQRLHATNLQPTEIAPSQPATNRQHPIGAGGLQVRDMTVIEELLAVQRAENLGTPELLEPETLGDTRVASVSDLFGEGSA